MIDRRALSASLPELYRRYCELRQGLGQICSLIAVVDGLKPVLDDWVDVGGEAEMQQVAQDLGLAMVTDEVFVPADRVGDLDGVIGADLLNTTRARVGDASGGRLHFYLGRHQEDVEDASRSGWYNLVAGDRVVPKPWIDHFWFGQKLGYPSCCLRAFATHGAWNAANPYAAAAVATVRRPQPLCNPSMRHTGLAYTVHYPCSFDCQETVGYGTAVREAVARCCPDLAAASDALATGWVLMLSGWDAIRLRGGRQTEGGITYLGADAAPTNNADTELLALIRSGDRLEVRGDVIVVWRDARVVGTRSVRADRYAPEHAVLVEFDPVLLASPRLATAQVTVR